MQKILITIIFLCPHLLWAQTDRIYAEGSAVDRVVRVVDTKASVGGAVSVPVELISQGDENALGFSIEFDQVVLTSPSVSLGQDAGGALLNVNYFEADQGRLGIALALPAGDTFSAGEREIVIVEFDIPLNVTVDSTPILFSDQTISREISDPFANVLTAIWEPGTVHLFGGYECDIAPRYDGNEEVTVIDWVQSGNFVSSVDTINVEGNEFQRADAAPRVDGQGALILGDGKISVIDWVQCGRYAAGLDALTRAGGTMTMSAVVQAGMTASNLWEARKQHSKSNKQRVVRLPDEMVRSGEEVAIVIELEAEGDENALGFSLNFDPAYLTYNEATLGDSVTAGGSLLVNNLKADSGRVGFALAQPTGTTFNTGTQEILNVSFTAFNPGATDSTTITFANDPVTQEISDAAANVLEASFMDGTITIVDVESPDVLETGGFYLKQNYPNPFNSSTAIEYTLTTPGYVVLRIVNLLGQEMETLVDGYQSPGTYAVHWSGSGHESGIYFYQLKAENYSATRKLTLLR